MNSSAKKASLLSANRTVILWFIWLLGTAAFGQSVDWHGNAEYRDPERFETAVRNFEKRDLESPPPKDAILFIGSSTIRRWDSLATDMAPLATIRRGIGGSNFYDLLHYADRIVIPYQPRAIVIYSGGNDIQQNINPTKAVATLEAFLDKVFTSLPECRVYVLSIKISAKRWENRPIENQANDMMIALCEKDDRLLYIEQPFPYDLE
ncbi:MAG: GDSL-type esterase/lipase family protein, partial [Verrucomicrobiota bacterium]